MTPQTLPKTPLDREWFPAADLAGLVPGLRSTRSVHRRASQEGWTARDLPCRGGKRREYHLDSLPLELRAALTAAAQKTARGPEALWAAYSRLPQTAKDEANRRLQVLDRVEQLVAVDGVSRAAARTTAATEADVTCRTLRNWERLTRDVHRSDWVAVLAPSGHGRPATNARTTLDAYEFFKADYLRLEQPTWSACYERTQRVAAEKGWQVPALDTLRRRLRREIPKTAIVYARQGEDALKALYPAQERDRSCFHAMEAVCADGHRFDVFVRWPDGDVGRPMGLFWQDLFSGKLLAYRVDKTENADAIRLSLGDLVEEHGVPEHAYLDNGRGFASKWLTGGMTFRHRFKVKRDEPAGLLKVLGVNVHWTTPYHGQAKPIERAFRDLCEYVAKHPAMSGAYTGNRPDAKPANYGKRAVELHEFLQVLEQEVRAHNAREGRRTRVAAGRSFDAVFADSYSRAGTRTITADQRRLFLLAAEGLRLRRDGSVSLMGNRYWSEAIARFAGEPVVVRFDPQRLHDDVHVYETNGVYIGLAECVEAVGFNDSRAARDHARARTQWLRHQRKIAQLERRLTPRQLAESLPAVPNPPDPDRKVVRAFFQPPSVVSTEEERHPDDQADGEVWDELAAALDAVKVVSSSSE